MHIWKEFVVIVVSIGVETTITASEDQNETNFLEVKLFKFWWRIYAQHVIFVA